jgi:hypothetical protein
VPHLPRSKSNSSKMWDYKLVLVSRCWHFLFRCRWVSSNTTVPVSKSILETPARAFGYATNSAVSSSSIPELRVTDTITPVWNYAAFKIVYRLLGIYIRILLKIAHINPTRFRGNFKTENINKSYWIIIYWFFSLASSVDLCLSGIDPAALWCGSRFTSPRLAVGSKVSSLSLENIRS